MTGMLVRKPSGDCRPRHAHELASRRRMATVRCRQAERLLWAYVEALGDSNRAYTEYVRTIRSGSIGSIRAMDKSLREKMEVVRQTRRAFEEHAREHGCGD